MPLDDARVADLARGACIDLDERGLARARARIDELLSLMGPLEGLEPEAVADRPDPVPGAPLNVMAPDEPDPARSLGRAEALGNASAVRGSAFLVLRVAPAAPGAGEVPGDGR